MAIALADLLDEKQVDLDLRARMLENAARRLVELLAANGKIREPEKFLEQVLARERTSPRVVEDGVIFPHARTALAPGIVLGIGRSQAGIRVGETDARAHLIFLIGVPRRLANDYLVCVGTLARIVKNDEIRQRLLSVATAAEFVAILREYGEQHFASGTK